MGHRVLKNVDYMQLVVLIYKYANYDKSKAVLLYTYIATKMAKNRFNDIYIEKLKVDLNLFDSETGTVDKDISSNVDLTLFDGKTGTVDKYISSKIIKVFSQYEVIAIKSIVFDIMHKGYYE